MSFFSSILIVMMCFKILGQDDQIIIDHLLVVHELIKQLPCVGLPLHLPEQPQHPHRHIGNGVQVGVHTSGLSLHPHSILCWLLPPPLCLPLHTALAMQWSPRRSITVHTIIDNVFVICYLISLHYTLISIL